jgi:hypothetical protein
MTIDYLPPPRELPDARIQELRAELELFVASDLAASRRSPRRSWWARRSVIISSILGVAVVASGGTALAMALIKPAPVTDKGVARCYSVATYHSGNKFPGTTIVEATSAAGPGRVLAAVDTCSALWRAGILQPGVKTAVNRPTQSTYPVPALVGCTLPGGAAAVFPGDAQTCTRLGLAAELPPAVEAAQPLPSTAAAGPAPS